MSKRTNVVIDERTGIKDVLARIKATHSGYFKLSRYIRGLETQIEAAEKLPDKWRNQKFKDDDIGLLVECTRRFLANELEAALHPQEPTL